MRAYERTDEQVAQYLRLYSCLFKTTVPRWRRGIVDVAAGSQALVNHPIYKLTTLLETVFKSSPPITAIYHVINAIFQSAATEGQTSLSLWEQIEDEVKAEIRSSFHRYHGINNVLAKLKHYHQTLQQLVQRGQALHDNWSEKEGIMEEEVISSNIEGNNNNIPNNRTSDAHYPTTKKEMDELRSEMEAQRRQMKAHLQRMSRKMLIDDIYDHFVQLQSDAHLFHPDHYEDFLVYDKSVFNVFLSFVTHKWAVLALLRSECAQLSAVVVVENAPESNGEDPKFLEETYVGVANEFREELRALLSSGRLNEIGKTLFWGKHSFTCRKKTKKNRKRSKRVVVTYIEGLYDPEHYEIVCGHEIFTFSYKPGSQSSAYWSPCSFMTNFWFSPKDIYKGEGKRCLNSPTLCSAFAKNLECQRLEWDTNGNCWKYWTKRKDMWDEFRRVTCGSSPRRMYLETAMWIWDRITSPLLRMLGSHSLAPVGNKRTTASGYRCQPWKRQWPHRHGYDPQKYPGLRNDYCANPNDWVNGPWCYTLNPRRRWEECYDTRLPRKLFPGKCISPCGKHGYSYNWCVTPGKDMPHGGSWDYC